MKTNNAIHVVCTIASVSLALAGCALFGGSGGGSKEPAAAQPVTIELVSELEQPVCEVYAHYKGDEDVEGGWGPNRLDAGAQMGPGETITFEAPWDDTGDHHIDIKAMDCQGEMYYRRYDTKFTEPGVNQVTMYDPGDPGPSYVPTDSGSSDYVTVYLKNSCSSDANYCAGIHKSYVGVSNTMSVDLEVGTEITQSDGSNCGAVIHTITASDDGAEIVICQ